MQQEWQQGDYLISTDKAKLDIDTIHGFLTTVYWSPGIPRATVERALEHSLSFGVYRGAQQVGLARVITDYTTFAYIADVFILEAFRGQGLSKWLMEVVAAHPDLQGLRRWVLATRDAHELYKKTGFSPLQMPDRFMEKLDTDIYTR
ncbi:GNAT family N-acetyltransferase [Dictyobacter arantiisoli]|uniref:N-acetyltransferase n=1 Tax=Dictyobacter arantiisoli TaxID=2014874 RepID=A0A5A5THT2_9CHLR|nr:GNAT family N-acetyltransferase [Dictyobacter arantiisoli]GCF10579.1 N-acetyltransferase [Dictyobacter arantiisoli]